MRDAEPSAEDMDDSVLHILMFYSIVLPTVIPSIRLAHPGNGMFRIST